MQQSKYWELNTFQKAALTFDELQAFRKVELMIKGIIPPAQPATPAEAPSFHEFAKDCGKSVTVVKLGWSTAFIISDEDKDTLISLNLLTLGSKYINGEDILTPGATYKPEITTKIVYPEFSTIYADYERQYGDVTRLKKEWETYNKQLAEANKATQDLVDDWETAKENVCLYERIQKTQAEYLEMTGGDESLACKFLEKAFDADSIYLFNRLANEKSEQLSLSV